MTFTTHDSFAEELTKLVGEKRVDELQQRGYLAAQILTHRRQKKLTQQALAEKMNVAVSTIGRLEAGLVQPNYQTLLALSRVLETPIIIDAKYQQKTTETS